MNKFIRWVFLFIIVSCGIEYDDNSGYDDRFSLEYQNELFSYEIKNQGGIVTAMKNVPELGSKSWNANSCVYTNRNNSNQYHFVFDTYNNIHDTFYRESLAFLFIPKKIGSYIFSNSIIRDPNIPEVGYVRMGADGDVLLRAWYPSPLHQSIFSIDKIDSVKKQIHISFDVYFDYEEEFDRKQRALGSEFANHYWSKNINFLGGRGVIGFPK